MDYNRSMRVRKLGIRDVHTEHCCITHGCKYGDPNCAVVAGVTRQSYACEECDWPYMMAEDDWIDQQLDHEGK